MENKNGIFRESALERLSSPERLDQLMQVINSMDWIALLTFATLSGGVLIWSVVGRIPVTVDGRGIFTQPRRLMDLQANTAGQLSALNIRPGQCVQQGEILATIDPIELKQQLRLTQSKLSQIQSQSQNSLNLMAQRMQYERNGIEASRLSLTQRLSDSRAMAPVLQAKGVEALAGERASAEQRLRDAESLVPVMAQRVETRRTLIAEGALPREALLDVQQQHVQAKQSVADAMAQLKKIESEMTQTERQYLENLRSAGDYQTQLQDLDTRATRLEQEMSDTQTQRDREIQEVNREITRLEQQIATGSKIVSTQSGCILEVTATAGQVVQPGLKLANMQAGTDDALISGVLYFPVKDGKQLQPGMTVALTPDTVQRERYGGVMAKIKHVSPFPVTRQGATTVIGNPEVVESLMASGGMIEVQATLERDTNTTSGFKWTSSKGPDAKITSGTTATARATVEARAPITFVMPFLRDLAGLK